MRAKITLISFSIAAIFLLTACPYESDVPITEADHAIENQLLGKWIKKSDLDNENPEYFEISKATDLKYEIVKYEYQSSDSTYDATKYLTHLSYLKDFVFMNMQKYDENKYYLHRIDLKADEFVLYEVTDNIDEKFTSSKDLKKFVKKNMKLSFFYNKDEETYVKDK